MITRDAGVPILPTVTAAPHPNPSRRPLVTAACDECGETVTRHRRPGRAFVHVECGVTRSERMLRAQRGLSLLTKDQLAALQSWIDQQLAAQR